MTEERKWIRGKIVDVATYNTNQLLHGAPIPARHHLLSVVVTEHDFDALQMKNKTIKFTADGPRSTETNDS